MMQQIVQQIAEEDLLLLGNEHQYKLDQTTKMSFIEIHRRISYGKGEPFYSIRSVWISKNVNTQNSIKNYHKCYTTHNQIWGGNIANTLSTFIMGNFFSISFYQLITRWLSKMTEDPSRSGTTMKPKIHKTWLASEKRCIKRCITVSHVTYVINLILF